MKLVLLLSLFLSLASVAVEAPKLSLVSIKTLEKKTVKKAKFGGISAIAFKDDKRLLALTDDKGEFGPPRIHLLNIENDVATIIDDFITLQNVGDGFDPEGLVILPNGNLLVSSEGNINRGIKPAIMEFKSTGALVKHWPVPIRYTTIEKSKGGSHNQLFEGLTQTPKGDIFVAMENALKEDGALATKDHGSYSRFIQYHEERPIHEYAYYIDPIPNPKRLKTIEGGTGISDILALSENRFLVIERSYIETYDKNVIRLFLAELESTTTPIENVDRIIPNKVQPLKKTLLVDLEKFSDHPDNIEAIALRNGKLYLISDDNFSPAQKNMLFILNQY